MSRPESSPKKVDGFSINAPPHSFLEELRKKEGVLTSQFFWEMQNLSPADARDAHESVGLWWASNVLIGAASNFGIFHVSQIDSFALELTRRSRERKISEIRLPLLRSDNLGKILLEVAKETDTSARFFIPGSYTQVDKRGVVSGRLGQYEKEIKIWPPAALGNKTYSVKRKKR